MVFFTAILSRVNRVVRPFRLSSIRQSFTEALAAYDEAIELDSTNMSFLSNRAAVFFEQKEYEACIAEVGEGFRYRGLYF